MKNFCVFEWLWIYVFDRRHHRKEFPKRIVLTISLSFSLLITHIILHRFYKTKVTGLTFLLYSSNRNEKLLCKRSFFIMKAKRFFSIFLSLVMIFAFSACGKVDNTVVTDGSTSMEKVIGALGESFENENSDISVLLWWDHAGRQYQRKLGPW